MPHADAAPTDRTPAPSPLAAPNTVSDWLGELNERQRAAATHAGPRLLILAGAGTGKTTTLAARVAWLVGERGISPERILLLTFTRRAAREMVSRAQTLAQRALPGTARVGGGTFHSVANRLVRMHASALGLPTSFGVLDAGDAADLLDLLREEHGHASSTRRFPRAGTLLDIYSRTVNAQVPLPEVLAGSHPWCEEHRDAIGALFRAYAARKRALAALDLDDLLVYWRALAADQTVGARLAAGIDHVLVDEYQDVNGIQVDIVAGLVQASEGRLHVTAVGDDFQAIYGFRAASARHILEFPRRFAGSEVVTLERNYRSSEPILAVANEVAAQDRHGYPKRLHSDGGGGDRPQLLFPLDDAEQANMVCDRVMAAREEGMLLREQAVLFRTTHDPALLELELTRRRIPYVKYGGLRYVEAAHVKDYVALLRLADNRADELSWFRILQLLDGVGPVRARRMLDALRGEDGVTSVRRFPAALAHVPDGTRTHAEAIGAALLGDDCAQPAGVRAERLRAALAPLITLRYPRPQPRLADLEQLSGAAARAGDLARFVSDLVLDPPSSSADLAGPPHLDEDYLVLGTVHSAKGLEWDAVHLIAAYDGNFPADMSAGSEDEIAQERRLFYVALTRPRRRLHVYAPVRYHHRPRGSSDVHGYGRPSRFLTETVTALMEHVHSPSVTQRGPGDAAGNGTDAATPRVSVSLDDLF